MSKGTKSASLEDFSEENLLETEAEETEVEREETGEEGTEGQEEKPKKVKAKVEKAPVKKEEKTTEETEEEEQKLPDATKGKTEEVEEGQTEETDPETATKFFEEVQKLTGVEVEVEYGDTDPLSPQGVALREKAVQEATLDGFLGELEEKFPAVFRALQHANNGGDPAELFTQTTSRDYSKIVINDGDEALAKQILTEYYKARGVKNEAKIAKLLETDEDSTAGLVGEAKAALEELQGEQEEAKTKLVEEQAQRAAEQKKKNTVLVAAVDGVLESKQLGDFKITDRTEAANFRKFVLSNIRVAPDGKYEIATPLDERSLEKQLQYQYFQFKQGDLSKIIQQKVGTKVAENLKLRLKAEQAKQKTTTTEESKGAKSPSLQDY